MCCIESGRHHNYEKKSTSIPQFLNHPLVKTFTILELQLSFFLIHTWGVVHVVDVLRHICLRRETWLNLCVSSRWRNGDNVGQGRKTSCSWTCTLWSPGETKELQRMELHVLLANYRKHLPLERPASPPRTVKSCCRWYDFLWNAGLHELNIDFDMLPACQGSHFFVLQTLTKQFMPMWWCTAKAQSTNAFPAHYNLCSSYVPCLHLDFACVFKFNSVFKFVCILGEFSFNTELL